MAKAMNRMQQAYGEWISVVGTQGRFVAEASADLLKQSPFPERAMLAVQIQHLTMERTVGRKVLRCLSTLNRKGNSVVHLDTDDLVPADKPLVADAAYTVASYVLNVALDRGWLPQEPHQQQCSDVVPLLHRVAAVEALLGVNSPGVLLERISLLELHLGGRTYSGTAASRIGQLEKGCCGSRNSSGSELLSVAASGATGSPLRPGMKVKAKWVSGDGRRWYAATVASCNADSTVNVLYDDGGVEENVDRDHVKVVSRGGSVSGRHIYSSWRQSMIVPVILLAALAAVAVTTKVEWLWVVIYDNEWL
jgi:hypothetical protein